MSACLASGVASVLSIVLMMMKMVVFASVIVSWVGDPSNRIVQMIYSLSEPLYRPFRGLTSKLNSPIDFSPIIVLLLIFFIESAGVGMLAKMGASCQQGF